MESAYLRHIPQEDIYLFNTGNAKKAWLCFGCRYIPELKAHRFIVWAPNAQRVSLVGSFNGWDRDAMPMEKIEGGVWVCFAEGIENGALYKYCVTGADGQQMDSEVPVRQMLEQIVAIAREKELILLSDEIYDRLVMDGKEHVSTAALCPDLPVLTFNGLSKSHMICGFRCGWLAVSGPRQVMKDFIAGMVALTSMRLCGNALTQLVIPAALQDEQSTRELLIPGGRLYEQREAAVQAIRRFDCLSVVKNTAAFYIFPRIDLTKCPITDDKKFAMDLLHEKHILLVPGSGFDWPQPDHFRVVMLPEAKDLARAMTDVGEFLQTYRQ